MAKNELPPYHSRTTKIHPSQIHVRLLFTVKEILLSRGYQLTKEGDFSDLIISRLEHGPDYELLLRYFNDTECRNQIRSYVLDDIYPTNHEAIWVIDHPNFKKINQAFTNTFEWYIGEAILRFFNGFSFSYGVNISNVRFDETVPGDFDTLVVMRNLSLLYIECKTGGYKRKDILRSVKRAIALNCESVIIVATSLEENKLLKMLSDTQHPLLEHEPTLSRIEIKQNIESVVYEWHNCYFIHAEKDIIEQMKTILRVTEGRRNYLQYAFRPTEGEFFNLGFTTL